MRRVARRAPSDGFGFSDRPLKRAVKAAALADEKLDVTLGPREEKVMKHPVTSGDAGPLGRIFAGRVHCPSRTVQPPSGEAESKSAGRECAPTLV